MKMIAQNKNLNLFFFSLTIFITIFISGCSNIDEKIIPKDTFVAILAEMLIIENLNASEADKSVLLRNTLSKYKTSQQRFEKTRQYYSRDPQYWIKVYSSAKEMISAQADSMAGMNEANAHGKTKED